MIVVCAAIIRLNGKILIARRAPTKHLGGLWEFPGGKIEDGEFPEECLKREIFEELGLTITVLNHLGDNVHHYGDKHILLKAYFCKANGNSIQLIDHDKVEWVTKAELENFEFAPADIPFVDALIADDIKFNNTVYSIADFLNTDVASWGKKLVAHTYTCMGDKPTYEQRKAWFDCYGILQEAFLNTSWSQQLKESIYIVFEYELLRERGRRPDILLFSGTTVYILEFKGCGSVLQSHIDQVKNYARDLHNYHEQSAGLTMAPVLVLTKAEKLDYTKDRVRVLSANLLSNLFSNDLEPWFSSVDRWFFSTYNPLPSLIQSAQSLFRQQPLPAIKKAKSAGIPEALQYLYNVSLQAAAKQTHHLAIITGVPGSGKTLLGLQFVFDTVAQADKQKAVFLSGNGPLVETLQSSLQNNHFVQSVHGFLKQYASSINLPNESILIYDEAQRAWDAEKASTPARSGLSEPQDFVNIGSRKEHCLLIALVGEGQEIYLGEEGGMSLWADAITNSNIHWNIHAPEKLQPLFNQSSLIRANQLNLTISLRTHEALTLQRWVEALLDAKLQELPTLMQQLNGANYPIYLTRNFDEAKNYAQTKYEQEPEKTYGLMASSTSKLLPRFGVKNDYNSTRFKASEYFVNTNSFHYCRKLQSTITEFGCQGLELDFPIVAWDADWIFDDHKWVFNGLQPKAKNPHNLRKNSYRVLLTRGRDGMVIFVPEVKMLDATFEFLKQGGCTLLQKNH
ncbi:hypothetical protein BH10BAC3_BH10BAC3_16130 [soil metagenome]